MSTAVLSLIIIGIVLIMFATEIVPIAVTAVAACLAMAIFKIITFKEAFAGFGNDIIMLVVGMMVIGAALFETGVAELIGKKIIKITGTNEKVFLIGVCIAAAAISAFMSNVATVAMFMPIIASAGVSSGGKITKKNTYMGLGFAAVAGGMCTLVGSTPQLIAQGVLQKMGVQEMGFFTLLYGGLPVVITLIIFYATIGYWLQSKVFIPGDAPDETTVTQAAAAAEVVRNPVKMWISSLVLVGCVIAFVSQIWTLGTIALIGAIICIVTGCIKEKVAYQKIDWTAVAVLAGCLGFSTGLDKSGGGKLIADAAVGLLGADASPWLVFAMFVVLCTVLTNIMSNTAVTAMLAPISIFVAQGLGMNPLTLVIGIVIGANLSYATPIATTCVTMTLPGGYRFMDFVKVGGVFNVLALIVTILVVPLLMPLK